MLLIYDETGRITQTSSVEDPAHLADLDQKGVKFFVMGRDMSDSYIDVSDPHDPVYRLRPILGGAWSTVTPEINQTVKFPNVPPCQVQIGAINGATTVDHATQGDIEIVFALPGTYTVSFEAFPYRLVYQQFQVTLPQDKEPTP